MASKTLTALILLFAAFIAFPVAIGIIGAMVGVITGIFGAVIGLIGGFVGAVAGILSWIFSGNIYTVAAVVIVLILAFKFGKR